MKKRWAAFLTAAVLAAVLFPARSWAVELPVEAQAALLMEKTTGQVLYAKNEHEQLEPAERDEGDDAPAGDGGARRGAHPL